MRLPISTKLAELQTEFHSGRLIFDTLINGAVIRSECQYNLRDKYIDYKSEQLNGPTVEAVEAYLFGWLSSLK